MQVLIAIALKSLLIAGLTLALLAVMKHRSAAERSWVAHIGLLALVIMAFAPLVVPNWTVEAPSLLGEVQPVEPVNPALAALPSTTEAAAPVIMKSAATPVAAERTLSAGAAAMIGYAIPAAILLFITALALARLIALRARADVLVDGHWLSALARAQRRMGFKHGTALLTSNELASPISWGLMRPVILLNSRAVEASGEAEAILAHELAHVARMDWVKLLLARVATALFWFNPLVWLLAREAHQLREETADDAVLAADIADTDYAELLVGVARHECPGLLLGAHGVAPSKSSLARRVARVLDGKSVRGPVAGPFALGVFVGAVLIAAPLAALTLTPGGAHEQKKLASSKLAASEPGSAYYPQTHEVPADLPHIIAQGVSTSVAGAVAAIKQTDDGDFKFVAPNGATITRSDGTTVTRSANGATVTERNGMTVSTAPSGATVTVYPPDSKGRRRVVAVAPNGATAVSYVNGDLAPGTIVGRFAERRGHSDPIDKVIEMKAVGVTPEYVATMRAASPALRNADLDEIISMRAVGVTPEYIREMVAAGMGHLDADDLTQARAVGLTGDYIRGMAAAGFRGDLDEMIELRAVGVTPEYASQFKKYGHKVMGADQLVKMKAHNINVEDLRGLPPLPPAPPRPPRDDDDGG